MQDHVDRILEQWAEVRPDLDCSAMGVLGRIKRLQMSWGKSIEQVFKSHGLSMIEFDILATLRRGNRPLTPTELYQTLMLSSGAVSTRLEQLVQKGWVERLASEEDRRSCTVRLTAEGIALVDRVLNDHVANQDVLLAGLESHEQKQLADLLKKLALYHEAT